MTESTPMRSAATRPISAEVTKSRITLELGRSALWML
eukprot:CAMPEP_0177692150 /NCGR_PEP_ID=MMETSP0484_2-20121128/1696_1 /TAXON_ID=354590 /ORGANISM="Rhodomonas lens, Strain RHODO" /LENGTH=36 /DNA_ID= /DNA_START= /DNA_END= /DNA_ORIENTATION=